MAPISLVGGLAQELVETRPKHLDFGRVQCLRMNVVSCNPIHVFIYVYT